METQLTVDFSSNDNSGIWAGKVYVKYIPGRVPQDAYATLGIYPIHPDLRIITDNGGIVSRASGFTIVESVVNDYLSLSGGQSHQSRLPIDTDFSVNKDAGFFLDPTGHALAKSAINFYFDPVTRNVISNKPVIGYVPISYKHIYGKYFYYPRKTQYNPQTGYTTLLDTVYAFLGAAYDSLAISPILGPETVKIEVISLHSNMLVSELGAVEDFPESSSWEKPPGWDFSPKDGSYPDSPFVLPEWLQTYEQRRIHSVWYYVGNPNYLKEEHYHVRYEQPFADGAFYLGQSRQTSWIPQLSLSVSNIDSATQNILTIVEREATMNMINNKVNELRSLYGI